VIEQWNHKSRWFSEAIASIDSSYALPAIYSTSSDSGSHVDIFWGKSSKRKNEWRFNIIILLMVMGIGHM